MIDIAQEAKIKAARKEALKNQEITIDLGIDRIMVLPIDDEVESSLLIIPEEMKKKMRASMPMKAQIVAMGKEGKEGKPMWVSVGDVVYVFPTTFEFPIVFKGLDYLVYNERNILARDKKGVPTGLVEPVWSEVTSTAKPIATA